MLKQLYIIFWLCILCNSTYAQTVTWSAPPTYESLEECCDGFYKIKEQGKVGLTDITGKILIPVICDTITPFHEHLALALDYNTDKYQVKGIIKEHNGEFTRINNNYFVDKYLFFSDGKLAVCDDNNKYGYLQPNGNLAIGCQYAKAYPFYMGLACIHKNEEEVAYLKNDGSELTTELESQGYVLLTGTSFNEKGEAYVQGKASMVGVKRCIINKNGRILREAKYSGTKIKNYEYRKSIVLENMKSSSAQKDEINIISEQGKYGFANHNGIVTPVQFEEVSPFKGGYARVKKDGKYGILKLESGTYSGQLSTNIVKVKNGKSDEITYTIYLPSAYIGKQITLHIDEENGMPKSENYVTTSNRLIHNITPSPQGKEKNKTFHFGLMADGLQLWKDEQHITFEYIASLPPVLSGPIVSANFKMDEDGYVRADKSNQVEIYAMVENRSTEVLNITLTLKGAGIISETRNLSITPGSSAKVTTVSEAIKERKQLEITAETSTGLKQNKVIKVKPFI
ncbi:WG repeat-containing protein [Bacteroides rodentium]